MPSPEQILSYMRATIRCHSPQSIADWSIEDLRGAYHLLPKPRVSFVEWCDRMQLPESPQEIAEANDRFIDFARSLTGADISISPSPESHPQ